MRLDLNELQARFAAEIMHLGGVFLPSQVDVWLSHHMPGFSLDAPAHQRRSIRTRFLQDLFRERGGLPAIARTFKLESLDQQVGRMDTPYHYRLVGLADPRGPQVTSGNVVEPLQVYDYVVRHPDLTWYGAQHQKKALFRSLGIPRHCWPMQKIPSTLPHMPPTYRYFLDSYSIGLGDWMIWFPFPSNDDEAAGTLGSLLAHRPLFAQLRRLGFAVILIVCQRQGAPHPTFTNAYFLPPQRSDREALATSAFLYLLELACEFDDTELIEAQGGADTVRRRCQQLRDARKRTPSGHGRVMEILVHECQDLPVSDRGA